MFSYMTSSITIKQLLNQVENSHLIEETLNARRRLRIFHLARVAHRGTILLVFRIANDQHRLALRQPKLLNTPAAEEAFSKENAEARQFRRSFIYSE